MPGGIHGVEVVSDAGQGREPLGRRKMLPALFRQPDSPDVVNTPLGVGRRRRVSIVAVAADEIQMAVAAGDQRRVDGRLRLTLPGGAAAF